MSERHPFRFLLKLVVGLLVVMVLWLAGTRWLQARWEGRATASWQRTGLSLETLPADFPAQDADEATRELEKKVRVLGIDLVPKFVEDPDRPRPTRSEGQEVREQIARAADYVDAVLQDAVDHVPSPPDELASWLGERDEAIRSVEAHVLAMDQPPRWVNDVDGGFTAPLPNLLGMIQLQKVLAAVALSRAVEDDVEGAERALTVGWKLADALESRPALISRLIEIASRRYHVGLLRKLSVDNPRGWSWRLEGLDPERAIFDGLRFEAWGVGKTVPAEILGNFGRSPDGEIAWVEVVPAVLMGPATRAMTAGHSEVIARSVERMQSLEACGLDLEAEGQALIAEIPRWNVVARIATPNLFHSWGRAVSLELDIELTRAILEARAVRGESGAWPEVLDPGASSACPSRQWTYARHGDGSMEIHLDEEVAWAGRHGVILPLRFEGAAGSE